MAESITGGVFVYEGGNVLISDYSGEDIIQITSGKVDSWAVSGNHLVFRIGSGSLWIKDMAGRAVTIMDSDGDTTTQIYGNTGYSAQDVIKNLIQAWSKTLLTDTAKLDESIKLCSHFNSIQEAIDQMVADCEAAGNSETFLRRYCGIILDNADTGAITGWDAGGISVKTATEVIPETSTVQHIKDYTDASFVRDNVTINIAESLSSLTTDGKKVLDGIYSWWAEEALKLIEESYGVEFKSDNEINIALTPSATHSALTSNNNVSINLGAVTFDSDADYNGNGIDRTIAHEFTHVAQGFFMGSLPQFLQEGLGDLTCGIDDRRKSYISYLASHSDKLAEYLDVTKNGTGTAYYYAAGYMFLRYLAKQASSSYDSLSSHSWDDNVSIGGTNAADFLTGIGKKQTLSAGAGNDTLTAYGDSMKIFGGTGDDYILMNGNAISADGGADNDTLNNRGDNSTLTGGADDDLLINGGYWATEKGGANVVLDGGTGNDVLLSRSTNALLDGGAGNDLMYNGYRYYDSRNTFYEPDDYDYDTGYYNSDDTTILGGAGNDTIQNVGNRISIVAGADNDFVYSSGDSVTIDGGAGDDSLENEGGSFVKIIAGDGNDLINNDLKVTYDDYNWDTEEYDTVESLSPDNATINAGIGNDTINNGGANVLIEYRAGDGNDLIEGFRADSTLSIGGGNYSTAKSDSDIIVTVGKEKITLKGAANLSKLNIKGNTTTALTNSSKSAVTLSTSIITGDASARTTAIKITGNALDNSILGGSGKDTLYGKDGADYLRGNAGADKLYGGNGNDTLWGGTGNDSLWGNDGADLFIYSSGNDVIADYAEGDRISLGAAISKTSLSGSDVYFKVGSYSLKVKNAKDKKLSLMTADGKELSTIISDKLTLTNSSKAAVTLPASIVSADASARTSAIKIMGNTSDNTILGGTGKDTLYGKDGADYLRGNAGADKLYGGNGNDTLWGGTGNDSLWGNDGDDLFIYSSGNDVIADYAEGDRISLGAAISKTSLSGSDVYFKVGSYSLKVKNAKDKTLSLMTSTGKELSTIISDKLTLTNSSKAAVTLPASIVSADASARTSAIKIMGNTSDNSILGGTGKDTLYGKDGDDYLFGGKSADNLYGGNGNDTLWGGTGNDSLWGNDGADTFIYNSGDGKDVIVGFADDDMLQITGTFSASVNSAGSVVFKVGTTASAITLKNFTASTFNVNGDTYTIADNKFVKK